MASDCTNMDPVFLCTGQPVYHKAFGPCNVVEVHTRGLPPYVTVRTQEGQEKQVLADSLSLRDATVAGSSGTNAQYQTLLPDGPAEISPSMAYPNNRLEGVRPRTRKGHSSHQGSRLRRAPQQIYRLPILRALQRLDGRAEARNVLALVYEQVEHLLQDGDLEPLGSAADPRNPRVWEMHWDNRARWERKRMVLEGLLRGDSPNRVWETTSEGRRFLERHTKLHGR